MKDCNDEILTFHNEHVRLDGEMRRELRRRAEANEDRLKKGLAANGEPAPLWFQPQGSYAMRTTVQHPENDYDIDDGVVFSRESLKGRQGADKTPLEARQMVCDALKADPLKNFIKEPEVRPNCVRVYYKAGYHVDVPVYRVDDPESDSKVYELASTTWKQSSPQGVTDWFQQEVKAKRHPDEDDKSSQLRRMVRLLKKWAISRESANMPSGFILTVLTIEAYVYYPRDDEAFYWLLRRIRDRLNSWGGLVVPHPVLHGETITRSEDDACMKNMKERIDGAIDDLGVLFNDCSKPRALKAWKAVFKHSYFDEALEEAAGVKSFAILTDRTDEEIEKKGGGRFG